MKISETVQFAMSLTLILVLLSGCDLLDNEESRVPIVLSAPTGLVINLSQTEVDLTWNTVEHASTYSIYRCPLGTQYTCNDIAEEDCAAAVATTDRTRFSDTTIDVGDAYCYRIQALGENAASSYSVGELGYRLPANIDLLTLTATGPSAVLETQNASMHVAATNYTGTVSYAWQQLSGPVVTLSNNNSADVSFAAPTVTGPQTLEFEVSATDDNGTVTKTLSIAVNDDSIFVDAGNSSFAPMGQTVSLHGFGSGSGGSPSYSWQQISGPNVVLNNANTSNPTFVVPTVSINSDFVFELTFADGVTSATDRVTVAVPGPVATPLLHAPLIPVGAFQAEPLLVTSPQWLPVASGTTVQLSALASGGDGLYSWDWVASGHSPGASPAAAFVGASDTQIVSVAIPVVGQTTVYDFEVSATDGDGNTDSAVVQVQASVGAPLASLAVLAPPLVVDVGPLDAVISALAVGGTGPYAFSWQQLSGTPVPLGDANTSRPRFQVPAVAADTELTFRVTLTDGTATSISRDVKVLVRASFAHTPLQVLRLQALPPIEVLGGDDVSIAVGATGGDKNYSWNWTQLSGTAATIAGGSTNTPTITTPVVSTQETLTFQVTVTDGLAETVNETVSITALATASTQPLSSVYLPDQHVDEGLLDATITGLAQGGTGNYTYSWQYVQTNPRVNITLTDADKSVARFDVPGVRAKEVLRFDLTITDGRSTVTETLYVIVNDLQPNLDLGHLQDQRVRSGESVYLNGSTPSGGVPPYRYFWSPKASTPPPITLNNFRTANADFIAPTVSQSITKTFLYAVVDAVNNIASVSETITIDPAVAPLRVTLDGPDTVEGGKDVSFNAAVSGGVAPYTYTYSTAGLQVALAATANPSATLPVTTAATQVTVTLLVHDSDTPASTISTSKVLTVTAPPAAVSSIPPSSAVQCGDRSTGTSCSLVELVLTTEAPCTADTPYAMSDVYQLASNQPEYIPGAGVDHGSYQVQTYKRCANAATCDAQWFQATSDKPLCLNFDPNIPEDRLICHFCCITAPGEQACNTLDVPPQDTWFRP